MNPLKTIKQLSLSEAQVWEIVREWYTEGLYSDILQDAYGNDLEDICENKLNDLGAYA